MADKLLTLAQLLNELEKYSHKELHVHHTWKPDHSDFNGSNYQALQTGMRNYHVNSRDFADIAQHVTLFPDGKFLTGRDFGTTPASIKGHNAGAFCVEMIGNFDKGKDSFKGRQKESMVGLANFFYKRNKYIRFHHENASKSCPGTSIGKEQFMKEVKAYGKKEAPEPVIKKDKVPYPGYLIRKGSRGAVVGKIQKAVGVKDDQIFGKNTEAAVKAFQKKNKLSADGIVGKLTWNKLFN